MFTEDRASRHGVHAGDAAALAAERCDATHASDARTQRTSRQSKHGSGAIMCKSASCDNRHAGRRIIAHAALIAHIPIERRPSRRRLARRRARTRQPCSRLSRRQGKWCMVLASLCARSSSPNFTSRCARICTRADTREDMRTVAACTILGGVGTYGSRGSRSGGQEMISSDVLSDIPL